jgi:hypothetical protein
MGARLGKLFVGGLVAVSGPAWAGESFINGHPLQYNYEYHCNGERVVVGHCYDIDDNSFCQSYYSDRPYHNGFMIQPVEKRGDVIAKLDACYRAQATTITSTSAPTPIKARAPAAATPAITPPGLGDAKWSMLYMDDEFAIYFTAAGIKRTETSGLGWFTTVYSEPQNYPAANISGVVFVQTHDQADCTKRMIKAPDLAAYGEDGKVVASGPDPNASWAKVEADTPGARKLNILCGRPPALASKIPISGDHKTIEMHYLQAMMEAAHEAQMNAGQKPHQ